jgi:hypothetical protein
LADRRCGLHLSQIGLGNEAGGLLHRRCRWWELDLALLFD